MATSSASPKPNVGILSIGDMGVGIARLLRHHHYKVYTVGAGRSQHTLNRIKSAQIKALDSDEALVAESDIILSIVPPRDAVATAQRAHQACNAHAAIKRRQERTGIARKLTFIDLNAISPRTTKSIGALFSSPQLPSSPGVQGITRSFSFHRSDSEPELPPIEIDFFDGGIIGGPPSLREDQTWKRPSIVLSGPRLSEVLPSEFTELLNVRVVGNTIGPASALKACFASLSKGMIALSILSFTTAHQAGVLPALEEHLKEFNPGALAAAKSGLTGMPPKAYRWVDEMRQINETFMEEGGFGKDVLGETHGVFDGIAEVYKLIADDTVLGEERVESRKRGTEVSDVVECIGEGIKAKKRKIAGEDWRRNWA
ncbi:hypothetical protein PV08_07483 [Exophiala spinifera]|uniref:Phosphogluconate dehydrogenase NAD-binding putative C-terminal domain-containing protein n=1 Tax=Exophiala spinifera TaxID=91928 RepID=A0A0D2BTV9_9EURO|nr:uncharacterized protein PV08_07483 [Exophiala spinifera]KIW14699.1 hypothetical protein PV08_07483 [Exophiala spinifera]